MFWVWGNGEPVTSPYGTTQKVEVNRLVSWRWPGCSWGSKITVVPPQPHKFLPNKIINPKQGQMTNKESQVLVCAPGSWDPAFTLTFTCKWQLSGVHCLKRSAIMNCHIRLQCWSVVSNVHIIHCILEFSYLHRQNWSPCAYPLSDWHWDKFSSGYFGFPLSISFHLFTIFMFHIPR